MQVEWEEDPLVLFVGDDRAEAHHDIEIQDPTGRRLVGRRLPEGIGGIALLHELIGQHAVDSEDADDPGQVVIETDRGPGPARIGFLLGLHPSTVHRVLSRYGLARLSWLDRATGCNVRRYAHAAPAISCTWT